MIEQLGLSIKSSVTFKMYAYDPDEPLQVDEDPLQVNRDPLLFHCSLPSLVFLFSRP